jgi:hypothetical protein
VTTARDREEQDLRIDQMTINIEKIRADIADSQRSQQRQALEWQKAQVWETRKFVLQAIAAAGAAMAGGAGLLALVLHAVGKI